MRKFDDFLEEQLQDEEFRREYESMHSEFEIKRQVEANPYTAMTEQEMLAKLKTSREQGKYRGADELISDMRSKYEL
ncbi:MAG: hypothetical protein K2K70_06595 [Lachnospiraceae bacterium]|nr:hypothetical protein [Lachnospiraceae bacterium]